MALVTNPPAPPEMKVQVGTAASPLSVLQMPPPAAATQTRQKPALQPLKVSSASAVIRPETRVVDPVKVKTFGSVAVNPVPSPTCCQNGSGGGSAGLGESIIVAVAGVGVGVGVPFPFLPPFFLPFGVAVGVAVGEGVSV